MGTEMYCLWNGYSCCFTKYFDIWISTEIADYFLNTLKTFRAMKPPSPPRETTKRNNLSVGHQTAIMLDIVYYVLEKNLYSARIGNLFYSPKTLLAMRGSDLP